MLGPEQTTQANASSQKAQPCKHTGDWKHALRALGNHSHWDAELEQVCWCICGFPLLGLLSIHQWPVSRVTTSHHYTLVQHEQWWTALFPVTSALWAPGKRESSSHFTHRLYCLSYQAPMVCLCELQLEAHRGSVSTQLGLDSRKKQESRAESTVLKPWIFARVGKTNSKPASPVLPFNSSLLTLGVGIAVFPACQAGDTGTTAEWPLIQFCSDPIHLEIAWDPMGEGSVPKMEPPQWPSDVNSKSPVAPMLLTSGV